MEKEKKGWKDREKGRRDKEDNIEESEVRYLSKRQLLNTCKVSQHNCFSHFYCCYVTCG